MNEYYIIISKESGQKESRNCMNELIQSSIIDKSNLWFESQNIEASAGGVATGRELDVLLVILFPNLFSHAMFVKRGQEYT